MRLDVRLVYDKRNLALLRELPSLMRMAMDRTAEDVEEFVEAQVARHNRTGQLFASVSKQRAGNGWFIGHDGQIAPHATFVHWGTRPHVIAPRERRALRWPGPAGFRFARRVNHPGYKGDPWLVRAAAQAPAIFARHVDQLLAQASATQEA